MRKMFSEKQIKEMAEAIVDSKISDALATKQDKLYLHNIFASDANEDHWIAVKILSNKSTAFESIHELLTADYKKVVISTGENSCISVSNTDKYGLIVDTAGTALKIFAGDFTDIITLAESDLQAMSITLQYDTVTPL